MSDLVMAIATMQAQIESALNAAKLQAGGAIFSDWPTSTELAKVIAQNNGQCQVTLWPLKGVRTTRYEPFNYLTNATSPSPTVAAVLSSNRRSLTITNPPGVGDNIHCFFGNSVGTSNPLGDANFGPALGTETDATVANAIATALNALDVPGVTAEASGTTVQITGAYWQYFNIGGTGFMTMETAREWRSIQVSVWAPNGATRNAVGNAIIAGLGGTDNPRLMMSDGNIMLCLYDDDIWIDKAESSYSMLRWDIFFDIEYPITKIVPLVQVEGFRVSRSVAGITLPTEYFGNPKVVDPPEEVL